MEVHVAVVAGLHEETDAKMLPQGRFIRAENLRFQKEGRVVQRFGFTAQPLAPGPDLFGVTCVASANYQTERSLHFAKPLGGGGNPATWWQRKPGGAYTDPAFASCLSTIEAPRRTVATPTIRFSAIASDIAQNGGYLFVVYNDYDAIDNETGGLFYVVYQRLTMQQVASGVIVQFDDAASAYFNPKCISLSTDVLVFYEDDDEVKMFKFDTTTLTGAGVTLSPPLTFAAPITGHHASFDVCPYDDVDEVALCVETVIAGTSSGLNVYRIDAAGTVNNFIGSSDYGTDPKQVGICRLGPGTTTFAVACVTDGDVIFATWTNGGVLVGLVQTLDSSGDAAGSPCMGTSQSYGAMVAWARHGSPSGSMMAWAHTGWASAPAKEVHSLFPVSKPFTAPDGSLVCWCVDETHDVADNPDGQAGFYGTYRLVDLGILNQVDIDGGGAISLAVCAQEEALAGNWYLGESYDQRRHTVSDNGTGEFGDAFESTITALPTLVGAATTAGRIDFVEFRTGTYVDRLMPAKINGQVLLSGPRVREFDGSQLYESGLFQGPKEFTVEAVGGDGNFSGDYQYCAIFKWIDAGGRVHRSQVSGIKTITGGGEGLSHLVTIAQPPFSDRQAHGTVTIFAEVYRTEADKSVFFLVNPSARIIITPDLAVPLTFTDDKTDDEISANETIYTGDGDILDNGEPPPCRFLWAGENRVLAGGLEDLNAYAFSKRLTPGNALAFPLGDETAFRGTIEGEVTGVAQLDGVWFVGSRESIWAIVGDGPDDSGSGQFAPPRKLPSDTGFLSQRSICEVPQGLLFQGRGGKMYLLPRGGGSPVWLKATQDTMAAYPFITSCAVLPEEHTAYFACWNFDDDDGRLLVFDTDVGEWSVDELFVTEESTFREFRSMCVWGGKILLDGLYGETDEGIDNVDDASPTWITQVWESGDIRFFGAAGTGRCRRVHLLGEAMSANVNMVIEVSRDSGATWDTPAGAWDAGNPFADDRQYDLPYVRGGNFRFRLSATSSDDGGAFVPGMGIALNAMSFEVYPEQGLKRLAASKRT